MQEEFSTDITYDAFISYRREGGSDTARLIKDRLEQNSLRIFLDVDELKTGKFDDRLLNVIENSPNFILILSNGSLDRCNNKDDWVTKEIAHALKLKKNIIPVIKDDFNFPDEGSIPSKIAELPSHNGVKYSHEYINAVIEEIELRISLYQETVDVNTNFNMLGDIGSEEVKFDDLMPTWCSRYVFIIWPAVMLLQWLLVIPISRINGTWFAVDVSNFGLSPSKWQELHPLWYDVMFIVWNVLPFPLIWLLFRARVKIQQYMQDIYRLDRKKKDDHWKKLAKKNNFWAKIISNKWLLTLIILISSYACFIQINKLGKLSRIGEIYWWDWKISKAAYLIREIALFFDFIGLALLLLVVIAMVDIIWRVLRKTELTIDVNNGDRANGLGSLGNALSLFLPFCTVLAINSVIGTIDHKGQDIQQVFSDYLSLSGFTILYFVLLILPMISSHKQIQRYLITELAKIRFRRRKIEEKNRHLLDTSYNLGIKHAEQYQALASVGENLQKEEQKYIRTFTWPIRKFTLISLILLGLLPFMIFLGIQIL